MHFNSVCFADLAIKYDILVEHFARRLQVQERLTKQIADCIKESIGASGVAVMIECE